MLKIKQRTIAVSLLLLLNQLVMAQVLIDVHGQVKNETGQVIEGVTITVKDANQVTTSNSKGVFSFRKVSPNAVLLFSGVNTEPLELAVNGKVQHQVVLRQKISALDGVIISMSTGYQQIPKERATGSFVQIDNQLLNRSVSTDLISRLEGVTSGLLIQRGQVRNTNEKLGVTIRGRSTLAANADPLIVLDNFPFEGDINSINPNDIETITVLKDAAAASIWGARSGNGVLVITTKKGRNNQKMKVDLASNFTIADKPDLKYSQRFIPAQDFIELEESLFNKGYFNADINNSFSRPVFSPVIDILRIKRNGEITSEQAERLLSQLKNNDVRNEFDKYIYQKSKFQQHSIAVRGGTQNFNYLLSIGYDKNKNSLARNGNDRLTIVSSNTFVPAKGLKLSTKIQYFQNKTENNNQLGFGSMAVGGKYGNSIYPYARFMDENGPAYIVKDYQARFSDSMQALGYADWRYRPLNELSLADNNSKMHSLLINAGARYSITEFLDMQFQFQNERQTTQNSNYLDPLTYVVRNSYNQFTNRNPSTGILTHNFPSGGVLDLSNSVLNSMNYRAQINFNRIIRDKHEIASLAGAELRQTTFDGYNRVSYGYDKRFGTAIANLNYQMSFPTITTGSATLVSYGALPKPNNSVQGTTDRFISYFANMSYQFDKRYTVTASARSDGANLFGVKTNDKMVPLFHGGIGWNISNEKFYKITPFPYLRFRATYGYNGNVYDGSALLIARILSTDPLTGLRYGAITSPANLELRWEKIRNINLGLDFSVQNSIVSGTIEVFQKKAVDLIEDFTLAPSAGFSTVRSNEASMKLNGMDLTLNFKIIDRGVKWNSTILFSKIKDRVTSFDRVLSAANLTGSPTGTIKEGNSLNGLYSFPFGGLDPQNGNPVGFLNKEKSTEYTAILANANSDSLIYHGSSRPTSFGSILNTVTFRNFSFSFNILYKFGYFFRRPGLNLNEQSLLSLPNSDYKKRWQNPGDEAHTNIPSVVYPANNARNSFYAGSSALVEKADHIRFQDINISYTFSSRVLSKLPFDNLQLFVFTNNLGIIWRENKQSIDPDALIFPNPRSFSFGFRTSFK